MEVMTNTDVTTTSSTSEVSEATIAMTRTSRQPSNRIPQAIDELSTMTHDLLAGVEDQPE